MRGNFKTLTFFDCVSELQLTSQHPYAETFIGKPHVYTIDISNLELVESTIKEIISLEVT